MQSALLAGLAVLRMDWLPILALLLTSLGLGLPFTRALPGLSERGWLRVPFACTAGLAALAPLCFALVLLGRLWFPLLRTGAVLLMITAISLLGNEIIRSFRRQNTIPNPISRLSVPSWITHSAFILALLLLLLVRLSFLKDLFFPPYSDSAEHVLILQDFLTPGGTGQAAHGLANLFRLYYHVGAHSIVAWLSTLTGADPARALTLLGQLALTLAPLAIFALTGLLSDDPRAAWLAALLAAAGWSMPAFAANWGKVPALTALAALPAVIAGWLAVFPTRIPLRKIWFALAVILFLTGGLVFLHSRTLIVLLLAGAGALLARLLPRRVERIPWQVSLLLAAAVSLLVFLPVEFQTRAYIGRWASATAGLLAFAPFAFHRHPRPALAIFFVLAGMLATPLLPFPEVSSGYGLSWLDQPFLDMFMHLPLVALGGLGVSGLFAAITPGWPKAILTILLSLPLLWNLAITPFAPNPCCVLVRPSDLLAMEWLRDHLAPEEGVLVAAMPAFDTVKPIDAGAWIPALTGHPIQFWTFDFDWKDPDAKIEVCSPGPRYVYAGSTEVVFAREQLEYLDWVDVVFRENRVTIYRLECP